MTRPSPRKCSRNASEGLLGASPGPSTATRRPTGTATRSPASKPPPAPAPNDTCGSSTGRRAPPATTPAGGSTPTATKPSPASTRQPRRPDDPHQRALPRHRARPDDHRRVHPLLRRRPRTPAVRHHPPPPHRTRQGAGRVNAWTLAREILTPHGIDQRHRPPGQKHLEPIGAAIPRLLVFRAIAAAVALGGWLDDLGRPPRHHRPRTNPPRPIP